MLFGAVLCWVLLQCFCGAVLSCSFLCSAVFFGVVPCLSVLLLLSGLFLSVSRFCLCVVRLAEWHGALVLISAALCRMVLCGAVASLVVLRCVVASGAVLPSFLASYAAVARCPGLSLGAVLCCPVVLPAVCSAVFLCAVLWRRLCCAMLGCAALPAFFLPVQCSFASLALAGAICW